MPWLFVTLGVTAALLLNVTKHDYRVEIRERGRSTAVREGVGYLSEFKAKSSGFTSRDISISALTGFRPASPL